ncbi:MAG: addiction module protein [Wenzhouxiangella sp.]
MSRLCQSKRHASFVSGRLTFGLTGSAAAELSGVQLNPLLGAAAGDKMTQVVNSRGPMTAEPLQRLRSEVLALSEAERAELAHDLIQSLDAPRDNGVEDAWEREVSRRIREIDAGQAELVERTELRERIRAKLAQR